MSKQPLVYITILNWNGLEDTLECLETVYQSDYKNFKVIVVENGSEVDEITEIRQQFPQVETITNETNIGFAAGHNQAITQALEAGAEYVLLMNNDAVLPNAALSQLVAIAEKDNHIGMINPIVNFYGSDQIWFAGAEIVYSVGTVRHLNRHESYEEVKQKLPVISDTPVTNGSCLLVSKQLVEEIGMLDADYFAYVEDVDWGYRAQQAGYRTVLARDVVVPHKVSASANKGSKKITPFQAFLWGRNNIYFARKNLKGIQKLWFVMVQPVRIAVYARRFQSLKSVGKFCQGLAAGLFDRIS